MPSNPKTEGSKHNANANANSNQPRFFPRMKKLHGDMIDLFSDGDYSDLKIMCQGVEFRVHKAILFPRCDFFRACFTSGFKEGDEGIVDLDEDDPSALRIALQELYTRSPGCLKDNFDADESLNFNDFIQTWKLADKYQMLDLAQSCLAFVTTNETIDLLKKRSGKKWAEDLLAGLVDSKGLSFQTPGTEHNEKIRTELKKILLASKDLSKMTDGEEGILKNNVDLAIELLKFALTQSLLSSWLAAH